MRKANNHLENWSHFALMLLWLHWDEMLIFQVCLTLGCCCLILDELTETRQVCQLLALLLDKLSYFYWANLNKFSTFFLVLGWTLPSLVQSWLNSFCLFSLSIYYFFFSLSVNATRVKRQDKDGEKKTEESFEQELCKDKDAGEWFRLVANDGDSCRDVIQCTTSVSDLIRLGQQFRPQHHVLLIQIGTASDPLSSWIVFRYWEANLRLEGSCEELQAEEQRA